MKFRNLLILVVIAVLASVMLSGCGEGRTKISAVLNNTDKYMSKEIVIGGEVTKTYGINLIIAEAGAYQLDDGTGKIWVTTKNGVPEEGQILAVRGKVSRGMRIAGESFGAIIQEKERRLN